MTASAWLGDCGDLQASDPYGLHLDFALKAASVTAFTHIGTLIGLNLNAINDGLETILDTLDFTQETS